MNIHDIDKIIEANRNRRLQDIRPFVALVMMSSLVGSIKFSFCTSDNWWEIEGPPPDDLADQALAYTDAILKRLHEENRD